LRRQTTARFTGKIRQHRVASRGRRQYRSGAKRTHRLYGRIPEQVVSVATAMIPFPGKRRRQQSPHGFQHAASGGALLITEARSSEPVWNIRPPGFRRRGSRKKHRVPLNMLTQQKLSQEGTTAMALTSISCSSSSVPTREPASTSGPSSQERTRGSRGSHRGRPLHRSG
jgi:hypothetical protein